MGRVWKRFFKKIAIGLSVIIYMSAALTISGLISFWLGYDPMAGIFFGAVTFILLPVIYFILRETYLESKLEVERENRNLMNSISREY